MGKRQDFLKEILIHKYGSGEHEKPAGKELLSSKFGPNIHDVYKKLNGKLSTPPTRYGSWDIDLQDFIVELDEEQHFNRYRLLTLSGDIYRDYPFFNVLNYMNYCVKFESNCLDKASRGGYWKNNSTEKQFDLSSSGGKLDGNGSSRWKQRAYYDFLKDVASKIIGVPVIRLSIYDQLESVSLDTLLKKNDQDLVMKMVRTRFEGIP